MRDSGRWEEEIDQQESLSTYHWRDEEEEPEESALKNNKKQRHTNTWSDGTHTTTSPIWK